ncbi:uncharacterized protein T551_01617 [Pneumocystis jirovecii RU7]|uniref:Uncharacterized protein n=1 Tax=Pneumocystis jirovecii (strain RU7) TaxID=1408657 RepID=A0A0W4ZRS3_PNEJ7|nr:uncharacterized protein T551_01617 [Pneumocystis jirovecii RU7]KTW31065.1 hypothetical protein T551_01617 [Pneumocystis jirovecii RU7]
MVLNENEEMELGIDDVEIDHEKESDWKGLNNFSGEFKNSEKGQDLSILESNVVDIAETESLNTLRTEALYLKGVEDMSTEDVEKYCITYYLAVSPLIEWIDDSSCNLVYPDASTALSALSCISQSKIDTLYVNSLVPAKMNPKHNNIQLFIRHSKTSDKKAPGARERSRWYLFHPHPSEKRDSIHRHKRDVFQRSNSHKRIRHRHSVATDSLFKKNRPLLLSMLHDSLSSHSKHDFQISEKYSLSDSSRSNIELFPEKLSIPKVNRFVQILHSSTDTATLSELDKIPHKELFPEKLQKLTCKEQFFEELKKTTHNQVLSQELNKVFHKELFPEKLLDSKRQVGYFSSNDNITEKIPLTLTIRGSSKCRNKAANMF